MQLGDISIWGVVLVVLLTVASLALFWVVDRRTLNHSLRVLLVGMVQTALAGAYVWGLYELDSWFVNLLWLMLMAGITAYITLGRVRLSMTRLLPILSLAVFAGSAIMGGCMLLVVHTPSANRLFVPIMGLLVGGLLQSSILALRTYIISLRYTAAHRMYIQANGGTHLESLVPSIRRALRAALMPQLRNMTSPLFLTLPMLLCGMLIGGANVVAATIVTLLMALSGFAASVISAVLTLWLADRVLFDRYGKLNA